MRLLALILGVPLLAIVYVLVAVLGTVYFIDMLLSGRFLIYLIMFFFFPMLLTLLYWGAMAAGGPVAVATSEEDVPLAGRVVGLLVAPLGLAIGFLLWQAQNWFIYGLLDVTPQLYNWVFGFVGLSV